MRVAVVVALLTMSIVGGDVVRAGPISSSSSSSVVPVATPRTTGDVDDLTIYVCSGGLYNVTPGTTYMLVGPPRCANAGTIIADIDFVFPPSSAYGGSQTAAAAEDHIPFPPRWSRGATQIIVDSVTIVGAVTFLDAAVWAAGGEVPPTVPSNTVPRWWGNIVVRVSNVTHRFAPAVTTATTTPRPTLTATPQPYRSVMSQQSMFAFFGLSLWGLDLEIQSSQFLLGGTMSSCGQGTVHICAFVNCTVVDSVVWIQASTFVAVQCGNVVTLLSVVGSASCSDAVPITWAIDWISVVRRTTMYVGNGSVVNIFARLVTVLSVASGAEASDVVIVVSDCPTVTITTQPTSGYGTLLLSFASGAKATRVSIWVNDSKLVVRGSSYLRGLCVADGSTFNDSAIVVENSTVSVTSTDVEGVRACAVGLQYAAANGSVFGIVDSNVNVRCGQIGYILAGRNCQGVANTSFVALRSVLGVVLTAPSNGYDGNVVHFGSENGAVVGVASMFLRSTVTISGLECQIGVVDDSQVRGIFTMVVCRSSLVCNANNQAWALNIFQVPLAAGSTLAVVRSSVQARQTLSISQIQQGARFVVRGAVFSQLVGISHPAPNGTAYVAAPIYFGGGRLAPTVAAQLFPNVPYCADLGDTFPAGLGAASAMTTYDGTDNCSAVMPAPSSAVSSLNPSSDADVEELCDGNGTSTVLAPQWTSAWGQLRDTIFAVQRDYISRHRVTRTGTKSASPSLSDRATQSVELPTAPPPTESAAPVVEPRPSESPHSLPATWPSNSTSTDVTVVTPSTATATTITPSLNSTNNNASEVAESTVAPLVLVATAALAVPPAARTAAVTMSFAAAILHVAPATASQLATSQRLVQVGQCTPLSVADAGVSLTSSDIVFVWSIAPAASSGGPQSTAAEESEGTVGAGLINIMALTLVSAVAAVTAGWVFIPRNNPRNIVGVTGGVSMTVGSYFLPTGVFLAFVGLHSSLVAVRWLSAACLALTALWLGWIVGAVESAYALLQGREARTALDEAITTTTTAHDGEATRDNDGSDRRVDSRPVDRSAVVVGAVDVVRVFHQPRQGGVGVDSAVVGKLPPEGSLVPFTAVARAPFAAAALEGLFLWRAAPVRGTYAEDLLVAVLMAALAASTMVIGCTVPPALATVVALAHLLFVVVVRAEAGKVERGFTVVGAAVQLLLALAQLGVARSWNDAAVIATVAQSVQYAFFFARSLVLGAVATYTMWRRACRANGVDLGDAVDSGDGAVPLMPLLERPTLAAGDAPCGPPSGRVAAPSVELSGTYATLVNPLTKMD